MKKTNIILVGLMGCGKTTIGKNYAKTYNMDFLDLDEFIEKQEKKSINEIFKLYGEAYFRKLERRTILNIGNLQNIVISTGGGVLSDKENLELLKKMGAVIYLEASVDVLYSRIKDDDKRPLLKCENPKEKLKMLLEERSSMYQKADYIVKVDREIKEIIEEINEKVKS